MENFNMGWHLIYTKPRHEKKVYKQLDELGIDSYLPLAKKLRTWHDRRKYIDEPLFPSYVFIYLNNLQNYYDGIDVEGALYYVRTGKDITRVSDSVVNDIKLVASQVKSLQVSVDYFQPGQKVVINQGPLTGLNCELVEVNKRKMMLVRVGLLKRNILVSLPADHLMPA